MRHTVVLLATVTSVWIAPMNAGWSQEDKFPGGNVEAGKAIATDTCAACHGVQGISMTPGTPHLAGQYAPYIWSGLSLYKKGERNNRKMHGIVGDLSESDMVNAAAYYASLKPFSQTPHEVAMPLPPEEDPYAAVKEATAECAACHGEDGNSDIPGMPNLAGQHVNYLIDAIRSYQEGLRKNEEMQLFVEDLKGPDIEDMAYYYASMAPKQAEPAAEGDAFAGLAVTAPCAGCHADDGNNKDPKTPRLAGQDAEYLAEAARSYKGGIRAHDVMREAVATLRESDIKDMAAFYASKEPKALPIRKPVTIGEWVERCNRCHGPDGRGADPRFPILAGQDETYLTKSLMLYHGGERSSAPMQAMSFQMTESDIIKLAAYYARQPAK